MGARGMGFIWGMTKIFQNQVEVMSAQLCVIVCELHFNKTIE